MFCKIINGDIPCSKVYEDDKILAFHDINPQAPVHCLIVPKVHIASADGIDETNADVVAEVFMAAPIIAKKLGLTRGYRIITNIGEDGCQSVKHIHFHLVGGRQLSETMA